MYWENHPLPNHAHPNLVGATKSLALCAIGIGILDPGLTLESPEHLWPGALGGSFWSDWCEGVGWWWCKHWQGPKAPTGDSDTQQGLTTTVWEDWRWRPWKMGIIFTIVTLWIYIAQGAQTLTLLLSHYYIFKYWPLKLSKVKRIILPHPTSHLVLGKHISPPSSLMPLLWAGSEY